MFGFIVTFLISAAFFFVLGFIDGFTNGGLKWIGLGIAVLLFIWLVSKLGFGGGILVFIAIGLLIVIWLLRFFSGAIKGFMSFFTKPW